MPVRLPATVILLYLKSTISCSSAAQTAISTKSSGLSIDLCRSNRVVQILCGNTP